MSEAITKKSLELSFRSEDEFKKQKELEHEMYHESDWEKQRQRKNFAISEELEYTKSILKTIEIAIDQKLNDAVLGSEPDEKTEILSTLELAHDRIDQSIKKL